MLYIERVLKCIKYGSNHYGTNGTIINGGDLVAYLLDNLREGETIAGILAAINIKVLIAKNGSKYLDLRLTDGQMIITAKFWDYKGERPKGNMFYFEAMVGSYNSQFQLTINQLRPADPEEYNPSDFLPSCSLPIADLWDRWDKLVNQVSADDIRALLELSKTKYKNRFESAPGAIYHHHAYLGGCLLHSIKVAEIAINICDGEANRDLLIVGSLLHDIGKLFSYKWSDGVFAYTDEGQFLEHTTLGIITVRELAREVGIDQLTTLKLLHIIASHHGNEEWGAPVTPKLPEALIIHECDMIDSQTDKMIKAKKNPDGDWTKVFGLGYVFTGD